MKTTLKYNTIETFQRQSAWKKFIETLVDSCNGLFDGWVSAVGESDTDSMSEYTSFQQDDSPKELGLYEYISGKYILTADETVRQGKTYYKKSFSNDIQPQYPLLDYVNTNTPAVLKENISLKGLLRTLSLYGCKIQSVDFYKSQLPHTFKETDNIGEVGSIYGSYTEGGVTYDEPIQAIVDGNSGQDVTTTIDDENQYISNLYGYNQKHPLFTYTRVKGLKNFVWYEKKTDAEYKEEHPAIGDNPTGLDILPNNIYVDYYVNSIINDSNISYTTYKADNNNSSIVLITNELDDIWRRMTGVPYQITHTHDGRKLNLYNILRYCYKKREGLQSKIVENDNATDFIINDKGEEDLIDNGYIKYNQADSEMVYELSFSYNENVSLTLFTKKLNANNNPITVTMSDEKTYYVYTDSFVYQEWCFMNKAEDYFNISLPYLKNQLFADECTIKAQPLFLYNEWRGGSPYPTKMVSMCANTIDSTIKGGVGKITYEVEKYEKLKISTEIDIKNNVNDWSAIKYVNEIVDVYDGSYFYKWEQYDADGNYVKDVYTALNFENCVEGEINPLAYFFDGGRNIYRIYEGVEDYTNNQRKVIDGYVYINTFKQEYFEAMYFNHFIKVSPIDWETDGNTIKATKLYCDNLELVKFGDIVPYVVSYDRKGELKSSNEYNDIDCAIFSKIMSYNKRTHLLIVDKPVYFNQYNESTESVPTKYVVVAYENASPFNKISDLFITAPNESVKELVKPILSDFVSQNCNLWIGNTAKNLLKYSTQTFTNYNAVDNRDYIYMMFRLVSSSNSTNNYVSIIPTERIDTTGKKTYTFTMPETNGYNWLWLRHSGGNKDFSIFFELNEKVNVGDKYTLSFDVDGYNPSVIYGLMVKNFKLEKGDTTQTPNEPYEPIK